MASPEISKLSLEVIEDPEKNFGNLSTLTDIAKSLKTTPENRKFAVLSLTEIFRDITPSYRIATNRSERVEDISLKAASRRTIEELTLNHYENFLQLLLKAVPKNKGLKKIGKKTGNTKIGNTKIAKPSKNERNFQLDQNLAAFCLASLLESLGSFNHYEDVAGALISLSNAPNAKTSKIAVNGLKNVLHGTDTELKVFLSIYLCDFSLKKDFSVSVAIFELLKEFDFDCLKGTQDFGLESGVENKSREKEIKRRGLALISKLGILYKTYFSGKWKIRRKIFSFVVETIFIHLKNLEEEDVKDISNLLEKIVVEESCPFINFLPALSCFFDLKKLVHNSFDIDFSGYIRLIQTRIPELTLQQNLTEKNVKVASKVLKMALELLEAEKSTESRKMLKEFQTLIPSIKLNIDQKYWPFFKSFESFFKNSFCEKIANALYSKECGKIK